ncbi:MAG TPA: FtsQ-type POTRA domain-containing protein [Nitrospirales bacterium]|jgi:cell division protein FtsQ|nr:FtsQ-type POTRA domain-containing protein [Nitrospirales bacterium]
MIKRIRPNRKRNPQGKSRGLPSGRALRALLWVMVLVVGGGAGWYGWQRMGPDLLIQADRFFEIKVVDITKTERISRDEVLTLLDLPPGRGLILINPDALERALQANPWIRRATVRRVFPDTLAVELQEREPVAVLRTAERAFLVDQEGILLAESLPDVPQSLPVLLGVDYAEAVLREGATVERLRSGIALAGLLGQAVGRPMVVDLGVPGEVVAYDSGLRLRFGEGAFGDKVDRYRQVWDRVFDRWIDREKPASARRVEVDLRFRDKVIVREGR